MSRRRFLLLLFLVFATASSAIGVTWSEYSSRHYFQRLQQLRAQHETLDTTWKKLVIERSTWATPDRVERVAEDELGMTTPPARQIVIMHLN
jgi:cell division protein FtsL